LKPAKNTRTRQSQTT